MTDTIQALHDEIEAARIYRNFLFLDANFSDTEPGGDVDKWVESRGYIRGLQTAVRLLEQEPARELPY